MAANMNMNIDSRDSSNGWARTLRFFVIHITIASFVLWSSVGGPNFIEFLFPMVLGTSATLLSMLAVVGILVLGFLEEPKREMIDKFKQVDIIDPKNRVWNQSFKRFISFAGSTILVIATAQAGWAYVTFVLFLSVVLSYIMVHIIKINYDQAAEEKEEEDGYKTVWDAAGDVGKSECSLDGSIEDDLILKKE